MRALTDDAAPDHARVGGHSPDGQWIVFRLEEAGLATLYRIRPDETDLHAILPASSAFVPGHIDWGPRLPADSVSTRA